MTIAIYIFAAINFVVSLPLVWLGVTYWFRRDYVWERQLAYDARKGLQKDRERTRKWDIRIMAYGSLYFLLAFSFMIFGGLLIIAVGR